MDLVYKVAETDSDFEQILSLQKLNHHNTISREVQDREGFVFAEHTLEKLKTMSEHVPQVIAVADGQIIAYTLAMTTSMKDHIPSLTSMFGQFRECQYQHKPLLDYPFVIGGQVCVAESYRGMGIFPGLYYALAKHTKGKYRLCVTEIAQRNPRSLRAHQKMGFEIIRTFSDDKETWDIVAWDMLR